MSGYRVLALADVWLVILMLSQAAGAQQIVLDANTVTARQGDADLLQYRYLNVPFKPYVKELRTPSGVNVLLDAPPDHLHHHALMFACAVNNVDFWGEAPTQAGGHFEPQPGRQQHVRFDDVAVVRPKYGPRARFTEALRWVSQSGASLLWEQRTLEAGRAGKATLLVWESKLSVPEGKDSVVLSGSHYHGLGLRFVRSMDAAGEFRNPDNDPGVVFRGEERLTRSRWCAYTAQADGKVATVVMFDHPQNPRHPATWFTMSKPFAYMSATLRLQEEPLTVGAPLILRYSVALWDGRPKTEEIESVYREWTKLRQREVQLP